MTIVVVTRNEAPNIADCLRAILAEARDTDVEIVVIDAASDDGTCEITKSVAAIDPRVRLIALSTLASVGAARNVGLDTRAKGRALMFVSADATPLAGWLDAAREALANADVVYGAQSHAPPRLSVAAAMRGLRYHFLERTDRSPIVYASHVNAAYAPRALENWRFGESLSESALDDVLFASHAVRTGLRVAYAPAMIVAHKDVTTLRGEWKKLVREARGWGALRARLGWRWDVIGWAAALAGALLAVAILPSPFTWGAFVLVVVAPALRRITRLALARHGVTRVALATLLAPIFDLLFLASYAHGLVNPE